MINLILGARAQSLNPIVRRKADHVYRCRTTVSPSSINKFFMRGLVQDTDILVEAPLRYRKTFSLLTFTRIVLFSLFVSFMREKNIVINPVNSNTAAQSPSFLVEELCLPKTLHLKGKASQLAVLTFNNSPRTRLVALKCGSTWELVISVTLNSVGKPQPTSVPAINWWTWNPANPLSTWRRSIMH